MKKQNIFRAIGLCVILWGAGVIAVNNKSFASCAPDTGFSGLLQKAFFMQSGACNVSPTNSRTCAHVGDACQIPSSFSPGSTVAGACTQTFAACVCVAPKQQ